MLAIAQPEQECSVSPISQTAELSGSTPTYLRELRTNCRLFAAASIGLGFGQQLTNYLGSIFAPHLLEEFRWARSRRFIVDDVESLIMKPGSRIWSAAPSALVV
jgi:hypothetical protein